MHPIASLAAFAALAAFQGPGTVAALPPSPADQPAPLGATRTVGNAQLSVTLPASVTIGVSFFDPAPIPVGVRFSDRLPGPVKLSLSGVPAGLDAALTSTRTGTVLRLRNGSALAVGTHRLVVTAKVGNRTVSAPLTITRTRARILLVDDDFSGNNAAAGTTTLSTSDSAFRDALRLGDGKRACVWDTVVVDAQSSGPTVEAMEPYDLVVWYCGTSYGGNPDGNGTVGGVDENHLRAWLDGGKDRTLLLFSPGYINNIQGYVPSAGSNENKWNVTENTFLKRYLGCVGAQGLVKRFADADIDILGRSVAMGRSPLEAQLSPIHPASARALATAVLNPDAKGERAVPVVAWNRVGDANTAIVGFTWENLFQREKLFRLLLSIRISELR